MKGNKIKISSNSKERKKRRIATSNSPCLKYSFTDFPYNIKNFRANTLTKNKTTNIIKEITKKHIVNILSLSNSINFKKRNFLNSNQPKLNCESISREYSTNNIIKLKNNEKKKNISKNKKKTKPQQLKITVSNDFSFSNNNTPTNIIKEEKYNNEKLLNNNFNYINIRTNTFSNTNKYSPFTLINKESKKYKKNEYENLNTPKKNMNNLTELLKELNDKLKMKLIENKLNRNKRYNSIQKIFEELILLLPEENKEIFKEILKGIHDIISEYYSELKNLKEIYEINKRKILNLENDNLNNIKIIKEKDLEIEKLKKKISSSMSTQEQQIISKSTNSSFVNSLSSEKEKSIDTKKKYYKSESQNRIEELNKKNIFDLNALYFYEKVNMKSDFNSLPKSNFGDLVPPLNLDFEKNEKINEEKKKEEIQKKINENKLSFIEKVALSFDLS